MRIVIRLLLVAALVALGFWLWTILFPGPEKLIRKRIAEVARLASIAPGEGLITQGLRIQSLINCFDPQAELTFDMPGRSQYRIAGRAEMTEYAGAARRNLSSLKVELLDPNLALSPDKQSAVVDLTARVKLPDERDFIVQEMKFTLKKINGEWLIISVETVRTLSRRGADDGSSLNRNLSLDLNLPFATDEVSKSKVKIKIKGEETLLASGVV
ncbi:MAG TPA: hypothetical protein VFR76_06680 [Verrucomicrobiae bacterium]|nr:hypothetical protein [Verrucomicrobiae bacterium]